jgi:5-formyltetrahydrofolate cyclo-ligase
MTSTRSERDLRHAKAQLREAVLARIAGMPHGKQFEDSVRLCARLRDQVQWKKANTVLFFAPMPGEPDIWPLLAEAVSQGKRAALPCFDRAQKTYVARELSDPERDVGRGYFGIREPNDACPVVAWKWLDLILVPGVAFDLSGRRIGRGKGHYDRLLTSLRGISCGVAFDEQIVAAVPITHHDRTVDCILTPTRWVTPPEGPVPE